MMTRKDYVATAEILSTYANLIDKFTFEDLVADFEWDLLAIIIALGGAGVVIYYSIKENILLRKEIRRLQLALRDERKK